MVPQDSQDLSEHGVEWLALVRYQLLLARQQQLLPPPADSVALNTIQDAVESLLNLVAQTMGASMGSRSDFAQTFDAVAKALGSPDELVAFRPSILSLNSARVSFKHHGNAASMSTISRHVDRGFEFCLALTRHALHRSLDRVSLLVFVGNDEVKMHLNKANNFKKEERLVAAAGELRKGFDQLVRDYTQSKRYYSGRSFYSTKPAFYDSHMRDLLGSSSEVTKWLEAIDQRLKIVSLGLDMTEYIYFIGHTPAVHWVISGAPNIAADEGFSLQEEEFDRCYKFVLDTALLLPRSDFEYDAHAARRAHIQASEPTE